MCPYLKAAQGNPGAVFPRLSFSLVKEASNLQIEEKRSDNKHSSLTVLTVLFLCDRDKPSLM